MKILLTGGFGYLGGRLAQALLAQSHEVVLGTRRDVSGPVRWAPAARVVAMDWSSDESLVRACEGVDAIAHLAGMNARDCARDPVAALEFNGVASARLARIAAARGVRRFVFLSTAHVYGAALNGRVDESVCPLPIHPYATSHRAGEDAVRLVQASGGMTGVVIRLSNSFGAPAWPGADCWSLVVNDLCRQAVEKGRLMLRTTGMQRRDFVAMSEVCRAITLLLTAPVPDGDPVVNVGGEWAPTLIEVARLIVERVGAVLGSTPELRVGAVADEVGTGPLDYDIGRLRAAGFTPRREAHLEELDDLVRFCATHRESLPA